MKLALLVAALAAVGTMMIPHSSGSVSGSIIVTATTRVQKSGGGNVIITKTLRDRGDKVIGWGNTVCFDLNNGSQQCMGTFVFPKGKISVAGTRHNSHYFVLSITGGTGLYVGAGGTLVGNTTVTNFNRERLIFNLT